MSYRERLYSRYESGHIAHLYGLQTRADIERQFPIWQIYFGAYLPRSKSKVVLDIGCGNGGLVCWLQSLGYKAIGIDVSEEQIGAGHKLGITDLYRADAMDYLPANAATYDCIFARDILEHFRKEEILPFLDLVCAALKPGGTFIAQTVNAESPLWGRLRHGDFTHETAFTAPSIRQVLLAAGFRSVDILPQRPVVHGMLSAIRYALWRLTELKLKLHLLIETGAAGGIFTQNLIVCAKK